MDDGRPDAAQMLLATVQRPAQHHTQCTRRCEKSAHRWMQCGNLLECHSDTGFRAEPDKEGIIDGRSARGSNYLRMGTDTDGKEICNFIEAQVGMTKVAVRSTFTSETHGVIATTDGAICLALTFHEIRQGPVSHSEAMRLSD